MIGGYTKPLVLEYIGERNGGLYVAGTRMSLDSIVYCFKDGLLPETILGEFDTLKLNRGEHKRRHLR